MITTGDIHADKDETMRSVKNRLGRASSSAETHIPSGEHAAGGRERDWTFFFRAGLTPRVLICALLTSILISSGIHSTLHGGAHQRIKLSPKDKKERLEEIEDLKKKVRDIEDRIADSVQRPDDLERYKEALSEELKKFFVALVASFNWQEPEAVYKALKSALALKARIESLQGEGIDRNVRRYPQTLKALEDEIEWRIKRITADVRAANKDRKYNHALKRLKIAKSFASNRFTEGGPLGRLYSDVYKAVENARKIRRKLNSLCSEDRFLEAKDPLQKLDKQYPEFSLDEQGQSIILDCRAAIDKAFETCKSHFAKVDQQLKAGNGSAALSWLEKAKMECDCGGLGSASSCTEFAMSLQTEGILLVSGRVDEALQLMLAKAHDQAVLQSCKQVNSIEKWKGVQAAVERAAKDRHLSARITCLADAADYHLKKKNAEVKYNEASSAAEFQQACKRAEEALSAARSAESRCKGTNLFGATNPQQALCMVADLASEFVKWKGIVERNKQFNSLVEDANRALSGGRCRQAVAHYEKAEAIDDDRFNRQKGLRRNLVRCKTKYQSIADRFRQGLVDLASYNVVEAIEIFKGLLNDSEIHSIHAQALLGSSYKLAEILGEELEDPSEDAAEQAMNHFLAVLKKQIDYQLPARLIPTRVLKSFDDLRAKLKLQAEGAPQ